MSKRGPNKKPVHEILAKGGRVRKDRYVPKQAQMKVSKRGDSTTLRNQLKPPSELSTKAKKIWKAVTLYLHDNGQEHEIYSPALASYCHYAAQFLECSKFLKDNGLKYSEDTKYGEVWKPWPEVKMMQDASKEIKAMGSLFGLSPATISQINNSKNNDAEQIPIGWDAISGVS